ncbi:MULTISPECIES: replication initiation protein RepM [Acinetobacter]|jgi:plasmid replication initiation protein|uniref:RepB family plasmid replication initiator protein n=1 Tax=Acinetobacter johnsonii TaxID=40214 RepID=A0A427UJP5_ACIJO|nr:MULTISPECIES: replication initiation protein RepM [Acinetobacter]MBJ7435070.1 replication initiation protein [Acinetobacter sp.]MCU4415301.1 replication initiation protein RepM [Acinetobacter sp. WU_MDCI_Axc73]MDU4395419.1 replication initiation protein RepM [Acinetobacter ursingii]NWK50689.1 replication initiation protein [Acinetobacter sp. SwsAc7]KQD05327.1 DNA replication protein [Acinetobacter soli]
MSKELVVKTNRLNQAFQTLSLSEFHIVQLAIVDARHTGTGLSTDTPLRIDALRYAEIFGTTRQNAYQRMKEAEDSLFNRRFSFFDEDGKLVKSRWIQQVKYLDDEGAIELVFTLAVVQGISKIDGIKDFFTQYLLSQTAQLNSTYSARLYELLIQWKAVGKTPVFELETFREQLGIGVNEYKRMDHFKTRVLDLAITEISEKTDIEATYLQHKKGRSISGFSFSFTQKKSKNTSNENLKNSENLDLFSKKMTDAQRHLFANKLSELPDMNKYSQGTESYPQFAVRIAEMLQDKEKFEELLPYLKKVGFSTK